MNNVEASTPRAPKLPIRPVDIGPEAISVISPADAADLLRVAKYGRQRPVTQATVDRYADLIRANQFGLSVGWIAWVGCNPGIVNMQHRLHACVAAGLPVKVIVIQTHHDTEEERDEIYANLDRGKDRTPADYIRSAGFRAFSSALEQSQANRLTSAVTFLATGFMNKAPGSARPGLNDVQFRVILAGPYSKLAEKYYAAIEPSKGKLRTALRRAPVVAVGLALLEHQPALAEPWWKRIAENDNLKRNSPAWWMTQTVLAGRYPAQENLRLVRAIGRCWDAEYQERQIPEFRLPNDLVEQPLQLLGTPYTHKTVYIPEELARMRAKLGGQKRPDVMAPSKNGNGDEE